MMTLASDLAAGLLAAALAIPGAVLARRALRGEGPWPLLGRHARDNGSSLHLVQVGPSGATRAYRSQPADRVAFSAVLKVSWVSTSGSSLEPKAWIILSTSEGQLAAPVGARGVEGLIQTVRSWDGFDEGALGAARASHRPEVWSLWSRGCPNS